jgi:hypothetical protein
LNRHRLFGQSKPQEAKEAKTASADEIDDTSWLHLQRYEGSFGIVPLTLFCCDKTDTGTSTIFVAVTTIPFLRPNASTICPFTLNF